MQSKPFISKFSIAGNTKTADISTCYVKETILVETVAEALLHKPDGRRFHSRRCHWNFSPT